ncbi:AAA family ATPase [Amaricoccus macauensis]|uniref:AAA family ATPase n=1 Tax=Amaricoccus macauensis TaxID=57001 RepID=UPI003C79DBA4
MGYIITFAQQKGGAGKTTVLAHLAAGWARAGKSVALLDLDPQHSLTRWAELRADPNLTLIESRNYRAASDMKQARKKHDLVLVDCPGADSTLLDNVLRESDMVVAPCQPSAVDVWASQTVISSAARFKTPCRILLNRVPPRMSTLDDILDSLGDAQDLLLTSRLGNRVAFAQAFLDGRTAGELSNRSAAARETKALQAEIEEIIAA